jgi:2-dehydro-3-deoxy-D-gluconate 5-dehydrogenase
MSAASPFDLTGRVALVTGGNGGIGLGMARGMAKAGAAIMIAARNREKSAAAVAELAALGAKAEALEVDVADPDACRAMVETTNERLGRLDILVNNAGIAQVALPQSISYEDWSAVLQINLTAAMVACQAAHPIMKAQGGGKVIHIGSMYSIFGGPFQPAYAAAKGGLVQLAKSQAAAWARHNIQVNVILPGWITTEMTAGAKGSQSFSDNIVGRTPAGRWGEPEDFEGPAVFLGSPASDFVTGALLNVDGGFAISG